MSNRTALKAFFETGDVPTQVQFADLIDSLAHIGDDFGTGVATFLATPSSANLAAALTDETGSGANVFATSPTLVTPVLGVAAATSINKVTLTTPATGCTVTIVDGKTFTCSNTLTITGTDGSTLNVGTGGTLGTAAYTAATAYQPVDADLTTIAGLTATTDSFIQAKASAWAARTIAEVKTDLGLTGTNSGDQNVFTTIAVSGQSNVVSDAASDTLTLVGSGVTITTDASTDTITFTVSAGSIGGSTGATDNRILRADGVGGLTVQSSGVSIDDNGIVTLATGTTTGGLRFSTDAAIVWDLSITGAAALVVGDAAYSATLPFLANKLAATEFHIGTSFSTGYKIAQVASKIVCLNTAGSAYVQFESEGITVYNSSLVGGSILAAAANSIQFGAVGAGGGAAAARTEINKATTAIADATPTSVLTITIPNAAHSANVEVTVIGSIGAGGAIGANEASATNKYTITICRTTGVNAVAGISSAYGASSSNVAGGTTVTATAAMSAVSGGVSAVNSFTVNVTITKAGGSSANHTCLVHAVLCNANAIGVTLS